MFGYLNAVQCFTLNKRDYVCNPRMVRITRVDKVYLLDFVELIATHNTNFTVLNLLYYS
jgi:hypothetical protein